MTDLERAIQAVEPGFLTAASIKARPPRKMDLRRRMAYHKVPGRSKKEDPSICYLRSARKARISRSTSGSLDRKM